MRFKGIFLLALCACGGKEVPQPPSDVLSPERMTDVLVEMHLVEGARSGADILGDSLKFEDYQSSVFKRQSLSVEEWERSFAWYSRHPELLEPIYDGVIERLSTFDLKGGSPPDVRLRSVDSASTRKGKQEP